MVVSQMSIKQSIEGLKIAPKDITTLIVRGREWFDRINGNSYHSVQVTVYNGPDKSITLTHAMTYGYDSAYLQTAKEMLIHADILPDDARPLGWYCRENGIIFDCSIVDGLKRDLYKV